MEDQKVVTECLVRGSCCSSALGFLRASLSCSTTPATPNALTDAVHRDRACPKEDQCKCNRRQRKRELVPTLAEQAALPMYLPDGYGHVDQDGECGETSEESHDDQDASKEFRTGGQVGHPARQAQAADHVHVVLHASEDFLRAVAYHYGYECDSHREQRQRLQAVVVAHKILLRLACRILIRRLAILSRNRSDKHLRLPSGPSLADARITLIMRRRQSGVLPLVSRIEPYTSGYFSVRQGPTLVPNSFRPTPPVILPSYRS